jgi:hypothetical protein
VSVEYLVWRQGILNCARQGAKESGQFCTPQERIELGSLDRAQLARLCALFKAYTGERAWKAVGNRLQTPCYLSRGDHGKKIRSRKQRTDIGKYSFVNRTIQLWNQLPEDALGALSCIPSSFRKGVRKVINKVK